MPPIVTNQIKRKLVGISFIQDEAVKREIQNTWDARFMTNDAILYHATATADKKAVCEALFQIVRDKVGGFQYLAGQDFVFTCFYDLSDPACADRAAMMDGIANSFAAGAGVSACGTILQLGYLGVLPFEDSEAVRTNAKAVLAGNKHPLCLIAHRPVSANRERDWKPVAVLLDVMRRDEGFAMHAAGTRVGFLKYAEHDEDARTDIEARLAVIDAQLRGGDIAQLAQMVGRNIETLERTVADGEAFHPNAAYQPLNNDYTLRPRLFNQNDRRRIADATEGNQKAVTATGEAVIQAILQENKYSADAAKQILREMLLVSGTGCDLIIEQGQTVKTCFEQVEGPAQKPVFRYLKEEKKTPEESMQEQIQAYFAECVRYAVKRAKSDRLYDLRDAFDAVQPEYRDEKERLQQEQHIKTEALQPLLTKAEFLEMTSRDGNKMERSFSILSAEGGSSSERIVLYRESDDSAEVQQYTENTGARVYYIDENNGHILNMDIWEIKAVHALFYAANDQNLQSLIV